jgi:hypothetical protein
MKRRKKELEVIKLCFSMHCCCACWKMYIKLCLMFLFVLCSCCKNCNIFLELIVNIYKNQKCFQLF